MNSLQKSQRAYMSISPKSGARGLQGLICLKRDPIFFSKIPHSTGLFIVHATKKINNPKIIYFFGRLGETLLSNNRNFPRAINGSQILAAKFLSHYHGHGIREYNRNFYKIAATRASRIRKFATPLKTPLSSTETRDVDFSRVFFSKNKKLFSKNYAPLTPEKRERKNYRGNDDFLRF